MINTNDETKTVEAEKLCQENTCGMSRNEAIGDDNEDGMSLCQLKGLT